MDLHSFLIKYLLTLLLFCQFLPGQDSTQIQYAIVGMSFYGDYDVVKIKVPPWLQTSTLMEQIKLSILGPSAELPNKKTYIYVFSETDQVGEQSTTGAVFIPGKGFTWDLSEWIAKPIPDQPPSEKDLEIYNTLIAQIILNGSTMDNLEAREQVARDFCLSISQLDSIYCWVKYWVNLQQKKTK